MPKRTSKMLLVRLTAKINALSFQIRISSFARYTARQARFACVLELRGVIKIQKMTSLRSLQLPTLTGFHFTHEWKHRLELFLLTVCTEI